MERLTHAINMMLVVTLLCLLGTVNAQTLTNDTTLSAGEHTYTADLVVPNGITLTIDSGAVIKLGSGLKVHIQDGGKLAVNGSSANPVFFTSDDAIEGAWAGLYFEGARHGC